MDVKLESEREKREGEEGIERKGLSERIIFLKEEREIVNESVEVKVIG
jgi:hypothetical protein